ncbi:biotin/lipoyl-containing protein [Treponema denticola]|uniref:biotin/lipoyl-containing protein n=1 Tax=Treponema denticola TaxID=158 RepID=UPI002104073B|nr:biotin/lipoyl-containing protein [Treponema denticola]
MSLGYCRQINQFGIPVTQGGMPNTPLVSVGDLVARGQKIAETDKFMSAPVHSSVSGKVKKIEPHLVTGNTENLCFFNRNR